MAVDKNGQTYKTEDEVRQEAKEQIAGLTVGQLTSFKALGFNEADINKDPELRSVVDNKQNPLEWSPDGWYFDNEGHNYAIIAEFKDSRTNILQDTKAKEQLLKYIRVAKTKYKEVLGLLYNGKVSIIYRNYDEYDDSKNQDTTLKSLSYYLDILKDVKVTKLDKQEIYKATARINDLLHHNVHLEDLKQRMIFIAGLLAARACAIKDNTNSFQSASYLSDLRTIILNFINDNIGNEENDNNIMENDKVIQLKKWTLLKKEIDWVDLDKKVTQEADTVKEIVKNIEIIYNSVYHSIWNGEDVMAIFFNEFTRYLAKVDMGQVFTPDHIASLMYRITNTSHLNRVLDATCGSGTFLIKAMNNMIREVNGNIDAINDIKYHHLYGIEISKEVFALAFVNMLLHHNENANLLYANTLLDEAKAWIKSHNIDRVLMNPPYETKYKPLEIMQSVLENVEQGAICAFLLPNTKLVKLRAKEKGLLKQHKLTHIIRLPKIFEGMASVPSDVSCFIFQAKIKQNDEKIFACWIKDDGLVTIKKQGRHDFHEVWSEKVEADGTIKKGLEDYWVNVINQTHIDTKYDSIRWLDPNKDLLQYPDEYEDEDVFNKEFYGTFIDRYLFENEEVASSLQEKSKNCPDGLTQKDWIIADMEREDK